MSCRGFLFLVLCFTAFLSCEKTSPDAVDIEVDYSWGTRPGENRKNPEIRLGNIPENTMSLKIELTDLDMPAANHGLEEEIAYDGTRVIPHGSLQNYIGPSPPPGGHMYEYTVKALDEKGMVIGIGKTAKRCCPKADK